MDAEARASLRHFLSAALIFSKGDLHSRTLAAFDEWFALADSRNTSGAKTCDEELRLFAQAIRGVQPSDGGQPK